MEELLRQALWLLENVPRQQGEWDPVEEILEWHAKCAALERDIYEQMGKTRQEVLEEASWDEGAWKEYLPVTGADKS